MNQFYSMILFKAEIEKYVTSNDDHNFKKIVIQFYSEETKDGNNYKMIAWILQKDLSAYPTSGNLLAEGDVVDTNINSPFYFSSCELSRPEFKQDILDKVGGLEGNWDRITLKPLQNADGYLVVELSVAIPSFGTVTKVTNPCPPNIPNP